MMNNDKTLEMLTAIGAFAECTHEMYRQLRRQGFNESQALELTKTWLTTASRSKSTGPEEGYE